jgi:tRNA (guanine37-N1)-methyltransferase
MTRTLKDILKEILTLEEISQVYSSYDVIGDIIIIKLPGSLNLKKQIIAKTILENVKPAKSIFVQISGVQGDYRIRSLEYLAGINNTVTEYREHGCRFKVDVVKTYFSPRLSTERLRIAKLITNNEIIINMFGGVGTYSIIIAKKNLTCKVYNIDSNPSANELALFNAKLNKLQDRVLPICGDAREVINDQLKGLASRVLMPLPEKANEFIDSAVLALKGKKGIIHFFAHVKAHTKKLAIEIGADHSGQAFNKYNHKIIAARVVREVGPRIYQVVSDVYLAG